jgi:GNAT superfamily N-acetyltransferase
LHKRDTIERVRYDLDDDPARVDLDVVWQFMSTQAYWGRWRDRDKVARQLDGAWRVVGAYRSDTGAMIGFARAVSDGVGLAYLADVFVVDDARGHGIGTALVKAMIDDGPGAEFRWMLHTADAHELYRRFGFAEPDSTYLERPGKHAPISEP